MNDYLDTVKRNLKQNRDLILLEMKSSKSFWIASQSSMNTFWSMEGMCRQYPKDIRRHLLCDSNLVICGRRNVRTEELYMLKNTAEINHIHLDGVLVYDL